jgi:hypothetical protein
MNVLNSIVSEELQETLATGLDGCLQPANGPQSLKPHALP